MSKLLRPRTSVQDFNMQARASSANPQQRQFQNSKILHLPTQNSANTPTPSSTDTTMQPSPLFGVVEVLDAPENHHRHNNHTGHSETTSITLHPKSRRGSRSSIVTIPIEDPATNADERRDSSSGTTSQRHGSISTATITQQQQRVGAPLRSRPRTTGGIITSDVKPLTPRDPPYISPANILRSSYPVISGFEKLQDSLVRVMDRIPHDVDLDDKWIILSKYLDKFGVDHSPERVAHEMSSILAIVKDQASNLPSPCVPVVATACVAVDQVMRVLHQQRPSLCNVLEEAMREIHHALFVKDIAPRPNYSDTRYLMETSNDDVLHTLVSAFTSKLYFQETRDLGKKLIGVQTFVEESRSRRAILSQFLDRTVWTYNSTHMKSIMSAWRALAARERLDRQREKERSALVKELDTTKRTVQNLESKIRDGEDAMKEQILKAQKEVADRDAKILDLNDQIRDLKRQISTLEDRKLMVEIKAQDDLRALQNSKMATEEKYAALITTLRRTVEQMLCDPPDSVKLMSKLHLRTIDQEGWEKNGKVSDWAYKILSQQTTFDVSQFPPQKMWDGCARTLNAFAAILGVFFPPTVYTDTPELPIRERATRIYNVFTRHLRIPKVFCVQSIYTPGDEAGNLKALSCLAFRCVTPTLAIAHGLPLLCTTLSQQQQADGPPLSPTAEPASVPTGLQIILANSVTPDAMCDELASGINVLLKRIADASQMVLGSFGYVHQKYDSKFGQPELTFLETQEQSLYTREALDPILLKTFECPLASMDSDSMAELQSILMEQYPNLRDIYDHYKYGLVNGVTPQQGFTQPFGQEELWRFLKESQLFQKGVLDRSTVRTLFKSVRGSGASQAEFIAMLLKMSSLRPTVSPTLRLHQQFSIVLDDCVLPLCDAMQVSTYLRKVQQCSDTQRVFRQHEIDTTKIFHHYASGDRGQMTVDDMNRIMEDGEVTKDIPALTPGTAVQTISFVWTAVAKELTGTDAASMVLSLEHFPYVLSVFASYFVPAPFYPVHVKMRMFLNGCFLLKFRRKLGLLTVQD
eukprot:PhF_6_TR37457/c0_g1_i1/m.55108